MTCPHGTNASTVCRMCWEAGLQGQRMPNEAEATKRERAAVVRYLRALGVDMTCTHEERGIASDAADAIERGEHLKETP